MSVRSGVFPRVVWSALSLENQNENNRIKKARQETQNKINKKKSTSKDFIQKFSFGAKRDSLSFDLKRNLE